jgi:hypothetical protein
LFQVNSSGAAKSTAGKFEVQSRSRCTRYRCLVVCWSRNNNSLIVAGTRRVTRSASISLLCCSFFVLGIFFISPCCCLPILFYSVAETKKRRRISAAFYAAPTDGWSLTAGLLSHPKHTHTITTTRTDLPEVHHRPIN